MPYGKINGDPEISERAARDYVQQKLITWEQLGLFGAHLSREAAARRAMGRRNES
jgi:hypothetical protein